MALKFDPTKKIRPPTSLVKIFEAPIEPSVTADKVIVESVEAEKSTRTRNASPVFRRRYFWDSDYGDNPSDSPDHLAAGQLPKQEPEGTQTNRKQTVNKPYTELETNRKQTEHKPDTNRTQSEHKSGHKVDTNRTQTEHKVDTNRTQSEHKVNTKWTQTEHKVNTKVDTKWTQTEHKVNTKWTQTEHKVNTKCAFSTLVGLQREFAIFIYNSTKSGRSRVTEPLTIEHVSQSLRIPCGSVKTTLARLESKDVLLRVESKNGRGGWARFELSESIFRDILTLDAEGKLNTNRTQTEHKVDTNRTQTVNKPDTEPDTSAPYSSNLNTNTNTQTEISEFQIAENLKAIGVGQKQLAVLVRENILTFEEVQSSLDHFSHDVAKNLARVKTANFLFGCMRNKTPYVSSSYTETEAKTISQEIARIKQVQAQREELEELRLKEQYSQFIANNPSFLEGLRKENEFLGQASSGILERIGFTKWREQNTQSKPGV